MGSIALLNGRLITPFHEEEGREIIIEGSKISQMGRLDSLSIPAGCEKIDLKGKYVMPGFIDLHIHGAGGYDFENPDFTQREKMRQTLFRHGVTGILSTLTPKPKKEMIQEVRKYAEFLSKNRVDSLVMGIHCEGPFLNKEMHGAINPDFIWDVNMDDWDSLFEASRGYIKLMTIAPELPGAMDIIRKAASEDVVLSVGHSEAEFETIVEGIDNGISQVTHIYNAMPLTHHRSPGVLGAAYLYDELKVQLIADGVHVHPVTMRFLMKIKGAGGIILVSDAMLAAGQPDGDYGFAGRKINVKDGIAYTSDGSLAGSCLTLDNAVKNMVTMCDVPLTQASRMSSLNAARVLRLDNKKGILAVGKDADIAIMNSDLEVEATIFGGQIVYRKE